MDQNTLLTIIYFSNSFITGFIPFNWRLTKDTVLHKGMDYLSGKQL